MANTRTKVEFDQESVERYRFAKGPREGRRARGDLRLERVRASVLEGHRSGEIVGMGEVPPEKLVWADTGGAIL